MINNLGVILLRALSLAVTGLNEFLELFGDITIGQIVGLIFAGLFMLFIYKQVKKFFEQKIEKQNKPYFWENCRK